MRKFLKSFAFAARGIWYCVKNERNMRVHVVAACYVLLFSLFYDFTRAEYALVFLSIALVICAEMINTAIEVLINYYSPYYHTLARVAKDVAAGGVLVCAFFSALVGVALFWNLDVFRLIGEYFCGHVAELVLLLLSLLLSSVFVFCGPTRMMWMCRKKIEDQMKK